MSKNSDNDCISSLNTVNDNDDDGDSISVLFNDVNNLTLGDQEIDGNDENSSITTSCTLCASSKGGSSYNIH